MNWQLQARNFCGAAGATAADYQLRYEIAFAVDIVDAAGSIYDVNGAYDEGDAFGVIGVGDDSNADDGDSSSERAAVLSDGVQARVIAHWQLVDRRWSFVVGTYPEGAHAIQDQSVHSVAVKAARHYWCDSVDSYDRINCLDATMAGIPERERI